MIEIRLFPDGDNCAEPFVGKYTLRRNDTGYSVELLFFCLSAHRYDPLFRLWRGETRPGDRPAAEALLRAQLKLRPSDAWRFIGKDGRIVDEAQGVQTDFSP